LTDFLLLLVLAEIHKVPTLTATQMTRIKKDVKLIKALDNKVCNSAACDQLKTKEKK